MKPKYSKRTVDEAVRLLDVYASQAAWARADISRPWMSMVKAAAAIGASSRALDLAAKVWDHGDMRILGLMEAALEAAQRLREGWRP